MRRIADSYGVQTAGNLLVGFKYIGGEMDRRGPADFVFGAEESYGFLAGDHVRDKDGAVAAMLLCRVGGRPEGRRADARAISSTSCFAGTAAMPRASFPCRCRASRGWTT